MQPNTGNTPPNMQPNVQPNMQPKPGVTIRGRRFTLPWVIGGVVAVLVILSCGCCGTVSLASALNGGNGAQATATTGQSGQAQATHAPATPKATATPKPTPKPLTPAEAAQAAIAAQLTADGQTTDGLKVTWDASSKTLTVEHDAQDNLTGDLIKVGIQLDAFAVMKSAYTANWGGHPDTVIFHDNGATQDKYGNASKGPWGTAVLNSDTAALFNWGNLDRESAWNAYDVAYYISGL